MDRPDFFKTQASDCRAAAEKAAGAEARAFLQLARHYDREAQAAAQMRSSQRRAELNAR
jgi:hypothetical protein